MIDLFITTNRGNSSSITTAYTIIIIFETWPSTAVYIIFLSNARSCFYKRRIFFKLSLPSSSLCQVGQFF
ncbi:hypothetical protein BDV25DRAFT_17527 [Aspergillus avenaceus]|uniref:Uncharacterized protein n=1 Tax=Aspergillus avenaceus TaxID=36643 RepID=A0A5N6TQ08_ASPAV|nr:hypothetical protein BDV25DRAFT_17527 [Aspergillus avenaceus]